MRGEFEQIRKLWAPLAADAAGSFDLRNDAATVMPPPGEELVVTLDTLIEEIHFMASDAPALLAQKALRVNLSDVAAMGARPIGYLLSVAWSPQVDDDWLDAFASGLARAQEEFGLHLLGGDTVRTPGPITLSVTAFGSVPEGRALTRSRAKAGDILYVSGTVGDGALGLLCAGGSFPFLSLHHQEHLEGAYRLPEPRLALGRRLIGRASACLDVSDGLLADVSHLARESALRATLRTADVPLSPAAEAVLAEDPELFSLVLTGGDDYELAFAVTPAQQTEVEALSGALGLPLTPIGHFSPGEGLHLLDREGRRLEIAGRGWTHF